MKKGGFTIVEVVVVFLLILSVTFLVLPKSFDNTKQARFISKWTAKYAELEYMFSVIKAQKDCEIQRKFKTANGVDDRKDIVLDAIKPYLRITSQVGDDYQQFYMNGDKVVKTGRYYFDSFYYTREDEIVGLKWLKKECEDDNICGVLAIDVNGTKDPNTWGDDVFGINIYKQSIEPMGKGIEPDVMRNDCSKYGYGVYCSYYYLIGGRFD